MHGFARGRPRWSTQNAGDDGLTRFSAARRWVCLRFILLSVLVGVVLSALGLDPFDIRNSIQLLFRPLWNMGFDAFSWVWGYFLLGAVIVIPIWLIIRLVNAPRGR